MPRLRVIFLDQSGTDPEDYRFVMWADVPVDRQRYYAEMVKVAPGADPVKSQWLDATEADNTALQNGQMVEEIVSQRTNPEWTSADFQLHMQDVWRNFQSRINTTNLWRNYGSTWDGTSWTLTGGALLEKQNG